MKSPHDHAQALLQKAANDLTAASWWNWYGRFTQASLRLKTAS